MALLKTLVRTATSKTNTTKHQVRTLKKQPLTPFFYKLLLGETMSKHDTSKLYQVVLDYTNLSTQAKYIFLDVICKNTNLDTGMAQNCFQQIKQELEYIPGESSLAGWLDLSILIEPRVKGIINELVSKNFISLVKNNCDVFCVNPLFINILEAEQQSAAEGITLEKEQGVQNG